MSDQDRSAQPDDELVALAKKGDWQAFGVLYERYADQLYRYVRTRIQGDQDAEDLTENVFVRSFKSLGSYEERGWPYSAFLYKVARNLLVDYYRQAVNQELIDEQGEMQTSEPGLEERLTDREEGLRAQRALSRLPADYQEIIRLRVLMDLPTSTVAMWMNSKRGRRQGAASSSPEGAATGISVMTAGMDELRAAAELDRVLGGSEPIAAGSAMAEELAALVAAAQNVRTHLAPPRLTKVAAARMRARVLDRVSGSPASAGRRVARRPSFVRQYAFALASAVLVVAVAASGVGVAYAAGPSLPGDALYGVKLGLESARLALTLDPHARGEYVLQLADQRVGEIQALIDTGRNQDLGPAYDGYLGALSQVEALAADEDLTGRERALSALQHHVEVLQSLISRVPEFGPDRPAKRPRAIPAWPSGSEPTRAGTAAQ